MASTWVLKLAQVDKPAQPILIHVTQKQDTQLDLDLLATDGEEAFRGKVRQRNLSKLKSQNFEGSDKDWEALLQYALVSRKDSSAPENQTNPLEVDCSIAGRGSKTSLTITLRSRIEDITHRLGGIELSYSENTDDIDLFGWACQLADQRDKLEEQVISTRKAGITSRTTIKSLQTQLDELVQAKSEHEEQLLTKFADLLNEKKMKIRNQQRILSTAKVDQKALDNLQIALGGNHKATSTSKRKRDEAEQATEVENGDESEGFDAMDVDNGSNDGGRDGIGTPLRSSTPETETASEDDEVPGPTKSASVTKPDLSKTKKSSPPPPPRSLPFQRKGQKEESVQKAGSAKKIAPAAKNNDDDDDDDETESEDDEL